MGAHLTMTEAGIDKVSLAGPDYPATAAGRLPPAIPALCCPNCGILLLDVPALRQILRGIEQT
jgi:hypothetical protein